MDLTMKKVVAIGLSVSLCGIVQASWLDPNIIQMSAAFASGPAMSAAFAAGQAMAEANAKNKNPSTSTAAYTPTPSETPFQQGTFSEERSVATTERGSTWNRIENLLKQAELKYEIDKGGDYKLRYDVGHGRSQTIWIFANKEELEGCELVRLVSYAYHGTLTRPQAIELLSDGHKVGSWWILKDKNDSEKFYVMFQAMIPLCISSTDFRTCCGAVSTDADRLEKKWTDGDRF